MKILVFNGSPKKESSDTMCITRAFLAGMREAGPQEVRTIDVADRHIEFCRGCFACKRNGGQCVIDDDMRQILEEILRSDLLLFPQGHTVLTVPESPMFHAPEAAAVTAPRLELVTQAGRQYAADGMIDEALLAKIGTPMIPEEVYAGIVNGNS